MFSDNLENIDNDDTFGYLSKPIVSTLWPDDELFFEQDAFSEVELEDWPASY